MATDLHLQDALARDGLRWLFTGDSITHGALHTLGYRSWTQLVAAHLQDVLGRDDVVLNTAISGDTVISWPVPEGMDTRGVLTTAAERVHAPRPDIVAVMIGMNDSALGVDLEQYTAALTELVAQVRSRGAVPILATSQPIHGVDERRLDYPEYIQRVRDVADAQQVTLVDTFAHWEAGELGQLEALYGDAIHPAPAGHRHFAQQFLTELGLLGPDAPLARADGEPRAGLDPAAFGEEVPTEAAAEAGAEESDAAVAPVVGFSPVGVEPERSRPLLVLGDVRPLARPVGGHMPTRSWIEHLEEVRRFELGHVRDYVWSIPLPSLAEAPAWLAGEQALPYAAVLLVPGPADAGGETLRTALAAIGDGAASAVVVRPGADGPTDPGAAVIDLRDLAVEGSAPEGLAGEIDPAGAQADLEAGRRVAAALGWSVPPSGAVARLQALAEA